MERNDTMLYRKVESNLRTKDVEGNAFVSLVLSCGHAARSYREESVFPCLQCLGAELHRLLSAKGG